MKLLQNNIHIIYMTTQKQKDLLIELAQKGYSNWQISIETGMKLSTVQFWKAQLRKKGIVIPALLGRPTKNSLKDRQIDTL